MSAGIDSLCPLPEIKLSRPTYPRAWRGKVPGGYRVVLTDHGPDGCHGERYWLKFYPGKWGFWSEGANTIRGIQRELRRCIRDAKRDK